MASKVVIVTGASQGIGFAVAQLLLGACHRVVLVSRSDAVLKELKGRHPGHVEYMAGDMGDLDTAAKVTELAIEKYGRLDGMVINHGVLSPMAKIADASVEDWRKHYDVNLFSALVLAKSAIPHLRKTKGRLIFVSSGAAKGAYVSWGAYGSSKAAINSLCAHIASEEPDIITAAIAPGRVDTNMQQEVRDAGKDVMAEADHSSFMKDYGDNALLKPEQPGYVLARLAVDAEKELSGQFLKWNDERLALYQKEV